MNLTTPFRVVWRSGVAGLRYMRYVIIWLCYDTDSKYSVELQYDWWTGKGMEWTRRVLVDDYCHLSRGTDGNYENLHIKILDSNQVPAEYTSRADYYTKLLLLVLCNVVHCIFRLAKECHKPLLIEGISFLRHGQKFATLCVISHKSEDLIYSKAEAWNFVYHRRYSTTDIELRHRGIGFWGQYVYTVTFGVIRFMDIQHCPVLKSS
jgi:hypothetical protein